MECPNNGYKRYCTNWLSFIIHRSHSTVIGAIIYDKQIDRADHRVTYGAEPPTQKGIKYWGRSMYSPDRPNDIIWGVHIRLLSTLAARTKHWAVNVWALPSSGRSREHFAFWPTLKFGNFGRNRHFRAKIPKIFWPKLAKATDKLSVEKPPTLASVYHYCPEPRYSVNVIAVISRLRSVKREAEVNDNILKRSLRKI